MSNLGREYFERTLSEAEEETLAAEMESSPEIAEDFLKGARKAYEETGLPEPVAPYEPPPGASGMGGWKILAMFFLAVTCFVGVGAWVFMRHAASNRSVPAQEQPGVLPALQAPDGAENSNPVVQAQDEALPPAQKADAVKSSRQKERYEDLGVVVKLASPSAIAVRVMDSQGREVRRLYTGTLSAGTREFLWDRKLQNGLDAPPGVYRIEVYRGGKSMSKEVRLAL